MNIFPQQADNPQFMETYRNFVRQYREEYYANKKLPHYTCNLKNPVPTFLIFLPSNTGIGLNLGNFINGIVYVNVQTQPYDNEDSLLYKIRSLSFQESNSNKHENFLRAVQKETPYLQLENEFGEEHEALDNDIFDIFNDDCVFQLQPQHYHYFKPFFQNFKPYQQLAQKAINEQFKRAEPPRNLLL